MTATVGTRVTTADTLVTAKVATNERITKTGVLTAVRYPAYKERTTKSSVTVIAKPAPMVRSTNDAVLVAILVGAEQRILRAWSFKQDDHEFYVLLAGGYTYVFDKLTEQWCQWQSPDASYYWRGVDGCDWNGINVCCDPDNGNIYQIDPTGRLDYNTTPIKSIIYGGLTERFRDHIPAYMLEVAISEASPANNRGTVGITLDSYDTMEWYNHGTITGSLSGTPTWVRFYGLGLIGAPGRLFRVTDTGVARRIDGINMEVGGQS